MLQSILLLALLSPNNKHPAGLPYMPQLWQNFVNSRISLFEGLGPSGIAWRLAGFWKPAHDSGHWESFFDFFALNWRFQEVTYVQCHNDARIPCVRANDRQRRIHKEESQLMKHLSLNSSVVMLRTVWTQSWDTRQSRRSKDLLFFFFKNSEDIMGASSMHNGVSSIVIDMLKMITWDRVSGHMSKYESTGWRNRAKVICSHRQNQSKRQHTTRFATKDAYMIPSDPANAPKWLMTVIDWFYTRLPTQQPMNWSPIPLNARSWIFAEGATLKFTYGDLGYLSNRD